MAVEMILRLTKKPFILCLTRGSGDGTEMVQADLLADVKQLTSFPSSTTGKKAVMKAVEKGLQF